MKDKFEAEGLSGRKARRAWKKMNKHEARCRDCGCLISMTEGDEFKICEECYSDYLKESESLLYEDEPTAPKEGE